MQTLSHKNTKNTLVPVHLAKELFGDQQEYVSKMFAWKEARIEADPLQLIEAGFEYGAKYEKPSCSESGNNNAREKVTVKISQFGRVEHLKSP